jgi:hypothetical protein
MSQRFAPLQELHERPDSLVYWRLPLPEESGAEHLALNVPAANRMAQLGALASITFRPQLPDTPVPLSGRNIYEDNDAGNRGFYRLHTTYQDGKEVPFWRDLEINVNLDTITNKLRDAEELHDPKAWAAQLNKLAVRGIKRAALHNTARNSEDRSMKIQEKVLGVMWLSMAYNALINLDDLSAMFPVARHHLAAAGTIGVAMEAYQQLRAAKQADIPFKKVPLHLFPFAYDRKAYIRGASHWHGKLIRHRPSPAGGQA